MTERVPDCTCGATSSTREWYKHHPDCPRNSYHGVVPEAAPMTEHTGEPCECGGGSGMCGDCAFSAGLTDTNECPHGVVTVEHTAGGTTVYAVCHECSLDNVRADAEADAVERIAAWLDGFNHQQWRPAYATITQEASRQFAEAIRRGDWRKQA